MSHGIDTYFLERASFHRRVALSMVGVGAVWLAALWATVALTRHHDEELEKLAERWGYEGPEQYVRRIVLESERGPRAPAVALSARYVPPTRRGGDLPPAERTGRRVGEPRRPPQDMEGDSEIDRLGRVRAQLLNVPLVKSENLIIERLVRPEYPELARARGIEGRVAVLALVDTTGHIGEVESVGASEDRLLETAAEMAVKKCRFRPYEVDGRKQAVYAMFHFSFKLE